MISTVEVFVLDMAQIYGCNFHLKGGPIVLAVVFLVSFSFM
jgi:hypothetical protein